MHDRDRNYWLVTGGLLWTLGGQLWFQGHGPGYRIAGAVVFMLGLAAVFCGFLGIPLPDAGRKRREADRKREQDDVRRAIRQLKLFMGTGETIRGMMEQDGVNDPSHVPPGNLWIGVQNSYTACVNQVKGFLREDPTLGEDWYDRFTDHGSPRVGPTFQYPKLLVRSWGGLTVQLDRLKEFVFDLRVKLD